MSKKKKTLLNKHAGKITGTGSAAAAGLAFGGKIGMVEMEFWKMFEIDTTEDLKICEVLMKAFLLNERDRG